MRLYPRVKCLDPCEQAVAVDITLTAVPFKSFTLDVYQLDASHMPAVGFCILWLQVLCLYHVAALRCNALLSYHMSRSICRKGRLSNASTILDNLRRLDTSALLGAQNPYNSEQLCRIQAGFGNSPTATYSNQAPTAAGKYTFPSSTATGALPLRQPLCFALHQSASTSVI